MKRATLKFGPGEPSGFTGLTTASFNDVPPARILRELLQNSLDAAVEAGEKTAKVRFEVSTLDARDVPDLSGYREAFREAVKYHDRPRDGGLSDPARQVVETIKGALRRIDDGEHHVLSVLDNGVGLDSRRMTSLLGDGNSAKREDAAGSYGVGHFSAVSASDLRYLLYGGVLAHGRRIGSGFTILASRPGRQHHTSARGYLVKKRLSGERAELFKFAAGDEVSPIVKRALSKIRREWRHGTVVLIPAFNNFGYFRRGDVRLTSVVTRVAAFNFSAAIHAGNLTVEVDEKAVKGGYEKVDATNLGSILEEEAGRVRAYRSDSWLSGLRPAGASAWAAYRTLREGKSATVQTNRGPLEAYVLVPAPGERTRLDLFRNGMWITDEIPELAPSIFADLQPFHAVLMPVQGTDLHRLVRKAEGPMHDRLAQNLLGEVEREQIKDAFQAVATWLKTQVPKIEAKTYTPDDFLAVRSGGDGGGGGHASYSMWGSPVVVQRARPSQRQTTGPGTKETETIWEDPSGGGKKKVAAKRTRRSRPLPFRSTGVPGERGKYNLEIECKEAVEEVRLRFCIDENVDATCDRLWPDEDVVLKAVVATGPDGATLPSQLEEGNAAIRLRGLGVSTYRVAIEYDVPQGFDDAVRAPVFRVDIHRPQD